MHIGPSDYVAWLDDRKWAYVRLEGRAFGDVPLNLEYKLEVWDSPNSAGIIIDAIRAAKIAKDRGIGGPIISASSYLMKCPPVQLPDDEGRAPRRGLHLRRGVSLGPTSNVVQAPAPLRRAGACVVGEDETSGRSARVQRHVLCATPRLPRTSAAIEPRRPDGPADGPAPRASVLRGTPSPAAVVDTPTVRAGENRRYGAGAAEGWWLGPPARRGRCWHGAPPPARRTATASSRVRPAATRPPRRWARAGAS